MVVYFFFFNDTATTEIYTLSLHDALPILWALRSAPPSTMRRWRAGLELIPRASPCWYLRWAHSSRRSEEHTSELQSQSNLVCRLLLEKKNYFPVMLLYLRSEIATVTRGLC